MRCTQCDTENKQDAIFCANCGAWVLGSVYEGTVENPLPEESPQDGPEMKKKLRLLSLSCCAVLVLIATIIGLCLYKPEVVVAQRYIYRHSSAISHVVNGTYYIVQGGSLVTEDGTKSATYLPSPVESLDGRTAVYRTNENQLLVIRDKEIVLQTPIASDTIVRLAAGGTALILYIPDGALVYADLLQGDLITIAEYFDGKAVISPDGQGVAYTTGEPTQLHYWRGDSAQLILEETGNFELDAISDAGDKFFAHNATRGGYFDASGIWNELAQTNLSIGQTISTLYLNADHSQGYFQVSVNNYFISLDSVTYTPLLPAGTAQFGNGETGITLPVKDLTDVIFAQRYASFSNIIISSYLQYSTRLWHNERTILESCTSPWLDETGSIVYYLGENQDLMRVDIFSGNEPVRIAEKVSMFCVSPDASQVYYRLERSLYHCDGMGKQHTFITDAFADTVYFLADGSACYQQIQTLFHVTDGKSQAIAEHIVELQQNQDGRLYAASTLGNLYLITDEGALETLIFVRNSNPNPDQ